VDTPTTDLDAERTLAGQIEEGLASLDDAELTEHPAAYEAMDEAVRAELRALERLTGDPNG
jgi:hypothetical protein